MAHQQNCGGAANSVADESFEAGPPHARLADGGAAPPPAPAAGAGNYYDTPSYKRASEKK